VKKKYEAETKIFESSAGNFLLLVVFLLFFFFKIFLFDVVSRVALLFVFESGVSPDGSAYPNF
jgi:hypothetical protein